MTGERDGGFKLRYLIGSGQLYRDMLRISVPVSLQLLITVGINLMDKITFLHHSANVLKML